MNINRAWRVGTVLLTAVACANARAGEQIVNGHFEVPDILTYLPISAGATTLTGWSVGLVQVDLADESNGFVHGATFDGRQAVDLDGSPGPGSISQTFPTVLGHVYTLRFGYADNYSTGGSKSATVRVYDRSGNLLGPLTISHGTSAQCSPDWVSFAQTFVANGTSATVEFVSQGVAGSQAGVLIDGVSVRDDAVPPPCPADINVSGVVNIDDLLAVINGWGPCPLPCTTTCDGDIVGGNGIVNIDDLLAVINSWGACP